MRVALVTDSTAYLPEELRARGDVTVVPLHVVIAGREHEEGVDTSPAAVASALRGGASVSTSRPAPQAFLDAYERAAAAGASAVVSVHISADMSSTFEAAELAASQAPVPVEVVDSRSLGMAMGYAVLSGAEAAAGGAEAEEVVAVVRRRLEETTVDFYVDTLEYLRRGGRIGAASAYLGSALAIKPILALESGRIVPLEKVRTAGRALGRLVELAVEAAEDVPWGRDGVDVAVHHLDAAERASELADDLRARVPGLRELHVVELGPVVGAHVGPGTLAVAVSPRPQRR